MTDFHDMAQKSLSGQVLSHQESLEVLESSDDRLLNLLQAAFTVRKRHFGKTVRLQMLINAKSGACQEDCHYCSQSSISTAPIDRYGLLSTEDLVDGARRAAVANAQRYCMVISGRGPLDREMTDISAAAKAIKSEMPIQICCSLGLLTEGQAKQLKEAGVDRINHNVNTSARYHPDICTTHTHQDRLATLHAAQAAGLEICSGGIIGMGEQNEDLIDLALTLRAIGPDSIPLNMLHAIPGTPLEHCQDLTPQRCLKALCLFRFLNPATEIRVAGGREHNLRSLQPLALYPADSLFVGGYLTTPGQEAEEVSHMIADLGFEVVVKYEKPGGTGGREGYRN